MPHILLKSLHAHPDNANRMTPGMMDKLAAHIRSSAGAEYPPLIIRPHPIHPDQFQILDGHHRAEVLRQLGHEHAQCEIWHVDDERAAMLLLTLNRLHGDDDPQRRAAIMERLAASSNIDHLAKLLPENAAMIRRLIEVNHAPPPLTPPPDLAAMPQPITFFLMSSQRARLIERLQAVAPDRSAALVQLLNLNDPSLSRSDPE